MSPSNNIIIVTVITIIAIGRQFYVLIISIEAIMIFTPIFCLKVCATNEFIYPIADNIAIANNIKFLFLLYTKKKEKSYKLFLNIIISFTITFCTSWLCSSHSIVNSSCVALSTKGACPGCFFFYSMGHFICRYSI